MHLTDERIEELCQQRDALQAESEAKAVAEAAAAATARQAEIDSAERRARVRAAEQQQREALVAADRARIAERLEAARAYGRGVCSLVDFATIERIATNGTTEVERLHAASGRPYGQIVPPFNDPERRVATLDGGVQTREEALAFVVGVREVFEVL